MDSRPKEAFNYVVIAMGEVTQGETDMIIGDDHYEFRAIEFVRGQDEAIAAEELMSIHLPDCKIMITHRVISTLHYMFDIKNIEADMRLVGQKLPKLTSNNDRYDCAYDWRNAYLIDATGGIQ